MDGRTHLAVGLGSGCLAGIAAWKSELVATGEEAAILAALWTGFSQFPDLDTASHPQRWFYRAAGAVLLLWALGGQWQAAAIAGMLVMLPLFDHHRGWTHRWWAAAVVPLAVLVMWRLFTGEARAWAWEDPAEGAAAVTGIMVRDFCAYLAMAGGYLTHLLADRIRIRRH